MTLSRMRDRGGCAESRLDQSDSERYDQLAGALDVEVETRSLT